MKIGDWTPKDRVLIVAEIGNNHEGDPERAAQTIREASAAGADAVKFQTFATEEFIHASDTDRFARMQRFELSPDAFRDLAHVARECGVLFISTPLDLPSADLLEPLVDAFKIASADNTFYPLLERVGRSETPIILSTGLADAARIAAAIACIEAAAKVSGHTPHIALLHCVTNYPVPPTAANISAITELASTFQYPVGYSDHTLGIEAAAIAVAAGARIIEKHFTLDKRFSDFRDHQLSADPDDLRELVARIRDIEVVLGDGIKRVMPCEESLETAVRRSIVARTQLKEGQFVKKDDLRWVRPGRGIAPGNESKILNRQLIHDVPEGHFFSEEDFTK